VNVFSGLAGAQRISLDILSNLGDNYNKTIIFGGDRNLATECLCKENGIRIIYVTTLKRNIGLHDLNAFWKLYKIFRNEKYDIVHTNSTKPGILARIAARLAGVDFIVHTVHGIAFHKYTKTPIRIIYYTLEIFSGIFGHVNVSVNNFYLKYYPSFLGDKMCIYNGVDFSNLKKLDRKYDQDKYRVGFFARLDEQKDPLMFVKVANNIIKNKLIDKNVIFSIAGDGPMLDQVMNYIDELGLESYFEIHGWVENKSEYLSTLDLLFQPSLWEAFGLNIVEAAYLGVPAVASNVEGIPEVIEHGYSGLLSEPGDEFQFSENIAFLLNDTCRLKIMSENASKYVENKFTLDEMVSKYEALYS
jgi:glycosyltransferase involved in cell wall biosynthesis